jgi:hypothetical protein
MLSSMYNCVQDTRIGNLAECRHFILYMASTTRVCQHSLNTVYYAFIYQTDIDGLKSS